MKIPSLVVIVYGCLLLLGSLTGYLIAENRVILISGSLFAALIIASGLCLLRRSFPAFILSLVTSGFLFFFFLYRSVATQKVTAYGMTMLSILVFLFLIATKSQIKRNEVKRP